MPKKDLLTLTREEAMRVYHQDGILEIIAGAVLINFGFDLLNQAKMTSLFTYIPVVLFTSMKRQMTLSRLKFEDFNGSEKQVRSLNLASAVGLIIMLMLLSMTALDDPLNLNEALTLPFGGDASNLMVGLVLTLVCLAAGYLVPLKRFLYYALAPLPLGIISYFLKLSPAIPVFVFAFGIIIPGIRMMMQFTRAYPLDKGKK